MYKLCKTEQSANRQRLLEQGLLEMMQSCEFHTISISDLCDHMQIPRKSFYRYFSGKEGALYALIDHTLMQYEYQNGLARESGGLSARMELEHYFRFWQLQKPLLDALERSRLSDLLIRRAIEHVLHETGFHGWLDTGAIPGEVECSVIFAVCGVLSMVVQWHHSGYAASAEHMAAVSEKILKKPLLQVR